MRPLAHLTHLGPHCVVQVDYLLGRITVDNGETTYNVLNVDPQSLRQAADSLLEGAR
jgi:hypothetical protein